MFIIYLIQILKTLEDIIVMYRDIFYHEIIMAVIDNFFFFSLINVEIFRP
jgi:hypothetical protein